MITIHSANHTPEDYENLARFLDAGIEALCRVKIGHKRTCACENTVK